MGQDWCRMRLREGVDLATVQRLIEEQALAWSQYENIQVDWETPYWIRPDAEEAERREQAGQAYARASDELKKYLHIQSFIDRDNDSEPPSGSIPEQIRVYGIGHNNIFPRELRVRAYRSYLPSELPSQLAEWKSYIECVQAGEYRAFLLDLYLYLHSNNAKIFWEELQRADHWLPNYTYVWAKRILEAPLLQQIYALPEPIAYPRPIWTNANSYANHKTDPRYIELWQTINQMHIVRKEWNRKVPTPFKFTTKIVPFYTATFENYLQWTSACDDLLAWLQQCVADGVGLYFYG